MLLNPAENKISFWTKGTSSIPFIHMVPDVSSINITVCGGLSASSTAKMLEQEQPKTEKFLMTLSKRHLPRVSSNPHSRGPDGSRPRPPWRQDLGTCGAFMGLVDAALVSCCSPNKIHSDAVYLLFAAIGFGNSGEEQKGSRVRPRGYTLGIGVLVVGFRKKK